MNTATKLSVRKIGMFVCCVALSGAFAWYFQPKYHQNSNALTVLVTVFSILAGFLIAVMAIVANERALRGRSWKQNVFYLQRIRSELWRHSMLFYLYLVVLVLSFLAELLPGLSGSFRIGTERVLLFLACLAMLLSFMLPRHLTRRHIDDLEDIIRKQQEKEISAQQDS